MSVKFVTAEGTAGLQVPSAVPNFTLIGEYFWVSRPNKVQKCQNFPLFRPAGANLLSYVDEIYRVYADNRSTKAINI